MLQRWLEAVNLQPVFTIACIAGVLITVFVMQTTWQESENRENSLLRWFRRGSQFALAASFLWALNYANETSWQPWPPFVAIVIAADAVLLGRAFSAAHRAPDGSGIQFQHKTLTLFLFAFTLVTLITGGMLLDRAQPYERSVGEIIPPVVARGEQVVVRWTGVKKRDCPGLVHRVFIDSENHFHPVESVTAAYAPVGPGLPLFRTLTIPAGMACGPAKYIARTEFYCNPMQRLWPIVTNGPTVESTVKC